MSKEPKTPSKSMPSDTPRIAKSEGRLVQIGVTAEEFMSNEGEINPMTAITLTVIMHPGENPLDSLYEAKAHLNVRYNWNKAQSSS